MPTEKQQIKATSNILNLLGDELIGNDSLAIFELVKNSYDADAENVSVSFNNLNTNEQSIVIEDDGEGMTREIVNKVWLTIGTNYKKKEAKTSKIFKRHSLGNKGVGRLAVHRLAESVLLETKTKDELFGTNVSINWKDLVHSGEFIEDLYVDVNDDVIDAFPKGHGTRITLTGLKTKKWTKKSLRDLVRKIEMIKDPLNPIENFNVVVNCDEDKKSWIEDIKSGSDILSNSLYTFRFKLTPSSDTDFVNFAWKYEFNPHNFGNLKSTILSSSDSTHLSITDKEFADLIPEMKDLHYLHNSNLEGIGPISGEFHVFNQQGPILDIAFGAGRRDAIKAFIKDNCGVKVFRDNIRVYNYGEPSDDWIGLDLIKIQRAGDHFGKKVTIGAISIDLSLSETGLLEKTNREGFSENDTFWIFRAIVRAVYNSFERTASDDKQKIDAILTDVSINKRVGLSDTIKELEEKLDQKQLKKEFSPLLKKVEKDYNDMRDVMLNSGMAGMNIGLVFHEVEREIKFIKKDVDEENIDISGIKNRLKNLSLLLENFSPILKQNSKSELLASKIVDRAVQINRSRFNYHKILFSSPLLSKENEDFKIIGPSNLLLSSISNIIDNAIYWVSDYHELQGDAHKSAIYIGTDTTSFDGNAIVIADTGEGFRLEPEDMVQPFKTLKEGGMGLGLYFVNLVMESIGGKLLFPDNKDLNIPDVYSGACIVLAFPKTKVK